VTRATVSADDRTITVHIPWKLKRRGGRKLILSPDGTAANANPRPRIDNAMVKAVARAFRWRKLLETGVYGSAGEIAAAEKINQSYMGRVMRLTLLAPDIVEATLDGRLPSEMTLTEVMKPFPACWEEQRRHFRAIPQA
jgi:hypothetical protein